MNAMPVDLGISLCQSSAQSTGFHAAGSKSELKADILSHQEADKKAAEIRMPRRTKRSAVNSKPRDCRRPRESSMRLLRIKHVMTGLSRMTIYRLERAGLFPIRRKLGTNSVGWIDENITARIASRPSGLVKRRAVPQLSQFKEARTRCCAANRASMPRTISVWGLPQGYLEAQPMRRGVTSRGISFPFQLYPIAPKHFVSFGYQPGEPIL
jgi:predicted DNA-binding transcriptional regulator AlpA